MAARPLRDPRAPFQQRTHNQKAIVPRSRTNRPTPLAKGKKPGPAPRGILLPRTEKPVSGKTESATPPESKPARKPKAKAKAPPGIPEKLPKKTKIERPPELPAPEPPPPPPEPVREPQRFSREDMHSMIHEYMQANKRNSRDARINMYRSWLTA